MERVYNWKCSLRRASMKCIVRYGWRKSMPYNKFTEHHKIKQKKLNETSQVSDLHVMNEHRQRLCGPCLRSGRPCRVAVELVMKVIEIKISAMAYY